MICYQKTGGMAHDLRLVTEDYLAQEGEILLKGDTLPSIQELSDPPDPIAVQKVNLLAQLAFLDAECQYNRGLREVILAFATVTKMLNQANVAGIPDTTGNIGIVKVQAIEDQAKLLRKQLATLA